MLSAAGGSGADVIPERTREQQLCLQLAATRAEVSSLREQLEDLVQEVVRLQSPPPSSLPPAAVVAASLGSLQPMQPPLLSPAASSSLPERSVPVSPAVAPDKADAASAILVDSSSFSLGPAAPFSSLGPAAPSSLGLAAPFSFGPAATDRSPQPLGSLVSPALGFPPARGRHLPHRRPKSAPAQRRAALMLALELLRCAGGRCCW